MSNLFGDEHVRRYIETDGEEGYVWREGASILLLTVTGRKSGREYTTPLIFGEDGGSYVLVASQGGTPEHPDWYLNLVVNPEVNVQVGGDRFTAQARTASAEEKPALWSLMTSIWPDYDQYQARTHREIPVVVVEPLAGE